MKLPGIDEYEFFWTRDNGAVIIRTKTQKALNPLSTNGSHGNRRYVLYLGPARKKVEIAESKIVAAMTFNVDPTKFNMPTGRTATASEMHDAKAQILEMQSIVKAIYEGLTFDRWGDFYKMAEDAREESIRRAAHRQGFTRAKLSAVFDEAVERIISHLKENRVKSYMPMLRWLSSEMARIIRQFRTTDMPDNVADNLISGYEAENYGTE